MGTSIRRLETEDFQCREGILLKNLQELPKLKDSISYLYLEHAVIEQNDTAIVAIQKQGRTPIPIAGMTCLLLNGGIDVTTTAGNGRNSGSEGL